MKVVAIESVKDKERKERQRERKTNSVKKRILDKLKSIDKIDTQMSIVPRSPRQRSTLFWRTSLFPLIRTGMIAIVSLVRLNW